MKQRGRPSSAALAIMPVVDTSVLERTERLRPPHDLTDEEVEIWALVTNAQPADWFSASVVPMLAQYCRHVVASKRIAELIERATGDKDLTARDYDRLLAMQERETRAIMMLATRMRLTPQSTTNHRGNPKRSGTRKPWEG